ncbi:MAG: GNAT family N-acetyltransferase [Chitinophagaceae bacterium]
MIIFRLIQIKQPHSQDEFIQIYQLNYQTFVEEIPQHMRNENRVLVDKFHSRNNYLIAKKEEQVIGMVCYCTERPFSLDHKLKDLDDYLPSYSKIAEVRLLSIKPENRNGKLAYDMLKALCSELIRQGIDSAVISGTIRQLPLYKKLGFKAFGPLVGTQDAAYQPMFITTKQLRSDFRSN